MAETKEEALKKAKSIDKDITEDKLTQDEDVLDTWFSSWLWPITVFDVSMTLIMKKSITTILLQI